MSSVSARVDQIRARVEDIRSRLRERVRVLQERVPLISELGLPACPTCNFPILEEVRVADPNKNVSAKSLRISAGLKGSIPTKSYEGRHSRL